MVSSFIYDQLVLGQELDTILTIKLDSFIMNSFIYMENDIKGGHLRAELVVQLYGKG